MKLEKVNEVGIAYQYEAVVNFLTSIGIKTDKLTISEVAEIKYALFSALEFEDSTLNLLHKS